MAMKLISRVIAREKGLKRYYTGKQCKHGHRVERNTSTAQCLDCCKRKDKVRRDSTDPQYKKLKNREKHLKSLYGISVADYLRLVATQNGRCALCGSITKELVVDHDHDTDKVRGLLCNNCNSIIGFANDNVQILHLAIDYLVKHL